MPTPIPEPRDLSPAAEPNDPGCAYPCGFDVVGARCGLPRRRRSSYCERHHALCHVAHGTSAEADQLRQAERLAFAVGGRQGWHGSVPSRAFLARLDHSVRNFL